MTDINITIPNNTNVITSYGHNRFMVGKELIQGSIIINRDHVTSWLDGNNPLSENVLTSALTLIPPMCELLLLGMGKDFYPLDKACLALLRKQNIPFDLMATASAVHTYNITVAEGRNTVALLKAIQ